MYAATCKEPYLHSAIFSAESLKDYFSNANITLYTEERWRYIAENAGVFDHIITNCPYNERTKLYMLSNTIYDKTFYIDADTEVMHEDIQYIFDELKDESDVCITKIRDYSGAEIFLTDKKSPKEKMIHHCGLFGFWNKPHILRFMDRWYQQYKFQFTEEFTNLYPMFYKSVIRWDQFAWWFLLNVEKYNLKIDIMNDDARWNFINNYRHSETQSDIVIMHHTLRSDWINGQINN